MVFGSKLRQRTMLRQGSFDRVFPTFEFQKQPPNPMIHATMQACANPVLHRFLPLKQPCFALQSGNFKLGLRVCVRATCGASSSESHRCRTSSDESRIKRRDAAEASIVSTNSLYRSVCTLEIEEVFRRFEDLVRF